MGNLGSGAAMSDVSTVYLLQEANDESVAHETGHVEQATPQMRAAPLEEDDAAFGIARVRADEVAVGEDNGQRAKGRRGAAGARSDRAAGLPRHPGYEVGGRERGDAERAERRHVGAHGLLDRDLGAHDVARVALARAGSVDDVLNEHPGPRRHRRRRDPP